MPGQDLDNVVPPVKFKVSLRCAMTRDFHTVASHVCCARVCAGVAVSSCAADVYASAIIAHITAACCLRAAAQPYIIFSFALSSYTVELLFRDRRLASVSFGCRLAAVLIMLVVCTHMVCSFIADVERSILCCSHVHDHELSSICTFRLPVQTTRTLLRTIPTGREDLRDTYLGVVQPAGGPDVNPRYKTRMCRWWSDGAMPGSCPHGAFRGVAAMQDCLLSRCCRFLARCASATISVAHLLQSSQDCAVRSRTALRNSAPSSALVAVWVGSRTRTWSHRPTLPLHRCPTGTKPLGDRANSH